MTRIRTTTRITKINLFLYVFFVVVNLFELLMICWSYYISKFVVSHRHAGLYYMAIDVEKFEMLIHKIANVIAFIFLIVWLFLVYRLMRALRPEFKANKVLLYIYWLIPIYSGYYVFNAQRKIIKIGANHKVLAKKLNLINLMILVFVGTISIVGFVSNIRMLIYHKPDPYRYAINLTTSVCLLAVSVLYVFFYKNYLVFERKLVLEHYSSPELNDTNLIDG